MSTGDIFNGILGLFIFFVCPCLIFNYIDKKIKKFFWKNKMRKVDKRIEKEKREVILKYETLIKKGVELYCMGEYISESSCLIGTFDTGKPHIISRDRSIYIALPIRDSDVEDFEKRHHYWFVEQGLKDSYKNKDINEYFYLSNIKDCEDVHGDTVNYYNYSFVADVGQVQRNDKQSYKWEISVVALEISKRV